MLSEQRRVEAARSRTDSQPLTPRGVSLPCRSTTTRSTRCPVRFIPPRSASFSPWAPGCGHLSSLSCVHDWHSRSSPLGRCRGSGREEEWGGGGARPRSVSSGDFAGRLAEQLQKRGMPCNRFSSKRFADTCSSPPMCSTSELRSLIRDTKWRSILRSCDEGNRVFSPRAA